MENTNAKTTTLVMLEERLRWAYQGSMALGGKTDWEKVNRIEREIAEYKKTH